MSKVTQDTKTFYTVMCALEIIGEAIKRIADYAGVNIVLVWKTATEDLPLIVVSR